jgi:protein-disulfide isomerase
MLRLTLFSCATALLIGSTAVLSAQAPARGASTPAAPAHSAARKSALDKAALEAYARHLWVLDPDYKVEISDAKSSMQLPGFKEVTVRVSQGGNSQEITLLVSNDGTKVLQGNVYDINQNPFKKELDKIKTQFQPSMGTPGAPVVIVMFSDFECPHCQDEAKMVRDNLLKAYPTQVRLYFKDFPLESIHEWAKPASVAGRCVFRQNPAAFWDYLDFVFAHQESISPSNLKDQVMEFAKTQKEIDALQLGKCMDTNATAKEVEANAADARALGVDATPTMFINGRKVPGGLEWKSLKRIIDNEIEYQKTAKDAGEDCGCDTKLELPGMPSSSTPGLGIKK